MHFKSRAFFIRVVLVFLIISGSLYFGFQGFTSRRTYVASTGDRPTYRLFNSTGPLPSTPFAIATFLTGQGDDLAYLNSTRILTYQLIHAPNTRLNTSKVTWLVACSSSLPVRQKQQLVKDGATVVEVDDVKTNWWIKTDVRRWKEQFTKLRLFEMTEYKRILFMDADTLILGPLDGVFQEPEIADLQRTFAHGWPNDEVKPDEAELPAEWLFAARSDNGYGGQRNHPIPPLNSAEFSAGFWIVAPNRQVFTHLLSVMGHYHRFNPFTMEQSLLNYVYRRNGPMPWRELNWKWSATWPSERDKQRGVATLHDKLWNNGPQELQDLWHNQEKEMMKFFGER
ncbi:glycosyltransferase family 8 protein [Melanomma pulvis-pyrius CBS 109.77]|uniref:Glycosyltransferase family 8 protein n=1 Tax=Melanomma pulvis-pyrius CBS 109.77 TaxID=1314802 RepID=A0A6A6XFE4_9PLEO|nr:glycosyltransferase family 8 protein [Melanomma pulvis-pyrius CBS 109.77]